MPVRSPSLVELHAFLAVARRGSFRKAAEDLCVTQAAVSRAVLRLEETLGQAMFERTGTGVRLTDAGVELRKGVEGPVAQLEAVSGALQRRSERLRLRLAVVTSWNFLWLVPRLEGFRRAHPQVELEFRHYEREEDFRRDDVDLWIVNRRGDRRQWPREVSARYLMGREMVAICAPSLATGVRTPAQLFTKPFLYHSEYPDRVDRLAHEFGLEPPTAPRTGFDLVVHLIEAACAGLGVGIVPRCLVASDLHAGRLVMPIRSIKMTAPGYYLCRRRAATAHPAADMFSDWLAAEVAASAAASEPASPAARRARG